jgi:hypothetical protein
MKRFLSILLSLIILAATVTAPANAYALTKRTSKVKSNYVVSGIHLCRYVGEIKPTCTENGYKVYRCIFCPYTLKVVSKKATGHVYKVTAVKATPSSDGWSQKICTNCGYKKAAEKTYRPERVILSNNSYYYTGNAIYPTVRVVNSAGNTINSENYTVTYSDNCRVGTATVNVTFKGLFYSGSMSADFQILAQTSQNDEATLTLTKGSNKNFFATVSLMRGSSKLSITGKRVTVEYSNSRSLTNAKTISGTANSNGATSIKLSSPASLPYKTYYVRAYIVSSGKKIYSPVKTITLS